LVAKEEGTVKMVDVQLAKSSAQRQSRLQKKMGWCTLEMVWYVLEARNNLISIGVLDEEGCRIQV